MHTNIATLSKQFDIAERPRLVEKDVWLVGWVNGRRMYYTDTPSNLRLILETDPRAFFVYGNAREIGLPAPLAHRGCSFRQLLIECEEGSYEIDDTFLQQLAPNRTAGLAGRATSGCGLTLRIYPWTLAMQCWYMRLRAGAESRLRRPPMKWLVEFFGSSAVPANIRAAHVSERTLKRDLHELLHPTPGSAAQLLSGEFYYLWSQCEDLRFVYNESDTRLRQLVERVVKMRSDASTPTQSETVGGRRIYQPL